MLTPYQDSIDRIRELAQVVMTAATRQYPTYVLVDTKDSAIAEALIHIAAALESLKDETP